MRRAAGRRLLDGRIGSAAAGRRAAALADRAAGRLCRGRGQRDGRHRGQDPRAQAWPTVFYETALPATAMFYSFGVPGETTGAALTAELPPALAVRPTLVTVWLNVDDLVAGVPVADYEARLGQLVHALRQGGAARVLVANTPYLDRLPLYLVCRSGSAACPFAGALPSPPELNAAVDAYNAAIARVTGREGAVLVDLHGAGEVPDQHPDWVSQDGFHPNAAGYAAVAARFAAALRASG